MRHEQDLPAGQLDGCAARLRRPVSAARLAEELAVSVRTVYRDVYTRALLGAAIEGAAGVGYLLCAGFFLPALVFGE
ncbi:MAG: helix-turn-helix domain-containing protein [Steroidobacteraceae bacterium]